MSQILDTDSTALFEAAQAAENLPPRERARKWIEYFDHIASVEDLVPGFQWDGFDQISENHANAITAKIKWALNIDADDEHEIQTKLQAFKDAARQGRVPGFPDNPPWHLGKENRSIGDAGLAIAD